MLDILDMQLLHSSWIFYTQFVCWIANLDEDVVIARGGAPPPMITYHLPSCHKIVTIAQSVDGSYAHVTCMRATLLFEIARLPITSVFPNHVAP